jgi:hypothetical protein
VDYPGGGTMRREILILIMSQKLDSIETDTELSLALVTSTEPKSPPSPSEDNVVNSVSVVLKNFEADQVCAIKKKSKQLMTGRILLSY